MTKPWMREGVFGGIVTVIALTAILILLELFVGKPDFSKQG